VVARNGREAVEAVEREAFDAVLMDVQMPEMSGLEAARAIRQLESDGECCQAQPLPIIAMTAHAMTGDRERCLEAGMNSYLSKPIQPDLLLKTLDELVVSASGSPTTHDGITAPGLAEREAQGALDASVYYDRASALRRIGGDESLLEDLMDLFVEDYPKQLHRIRDAQERGDHTALHSYAHTLKGTIGHFSAARALKAAGHLEEIAMGRDLAAIQEGIAKLEDELNLLKETFRQAANDRETSRA
jgi:two-component system, sensor histidine kinase and response regulator